MTDGYHPDVTDALAKAIGRIYPVQPPFSRDCREFGAVSHAEAWAALTAELAPIAARLAAAEALCEAAIAYEAIDGHQDEWLAAHPDETVDDYEVALADADVAFVDVCKTYRAAKDAK